MGSGTSLMTIATVRRGTPPSSPAERALETFLSTEADLIALHCDEHCGSITFMSPMLNLTAGVGQSVPFPPSMEHRIDRVFFAPVRWNLSCLRGASTSEQPIQFPFDLLNITDPLFHPSQFVWREASRAFMLAADEVFESGIESEFSRTLDSLLRTRGNAGVEALEALLFSSMANAEVAGEFLKWLGSVDHGESKQHRRKLLERALDSPSARIRYGAALGLAAMDDPASLVALHSVIERESHRRLQQYFQLVIDQLEATQRCLSS